MAVLVVAIALPGWIASEAQYSLRPVTGVVTDKSGNTLPGAVVQLENTRSLRVRSYITRKDGKYRFNGLNEDVDYTLRARYRRFWSPAKTLSKFNSSNHPTVNLAIPID
jgi:hypothetical protein